LWNKRDGYDKWIFKLQQQYGDIFEVWLTNEGLNELGLTQRGIFANDNLDSWKFNRYFFNQVMLVPNFNIKAVDSTNNIWKEMEKYWNSLGDYYQIDFTEWMQRFTIDMIIEITAGKRAYTLPVYFNKLTTKKLVDIPPAILDDSEYFIHNMQKYISTFTTFAVFPIQNKQKPTKVQFAYKWSNPDPTCHE
ncbi:39664_t:CDS:2, partial [Gigaspora margarita]